MRAFLVLGWSLMVMSVAQAKSHWFGEVLQTIPGETCNMLVFREWGGTEVFIIDKVPKDFVVIDGARIFVDIDQRSVRPMQVPVAGGGIRTLRAMDAVRKPQVSSGQRGGKG